MLSGTPPKRLSFVLRLLLTELHCNALCVRFVLIFACFCCRSTIIMVNRLKMIITNNLHSMHKKLNTFYSVGCVFKTAKLCFINVYKCLLPQRCSGLTRRHCVSRLPPSQEHCYCHRREVALTPKGNAAHYSAPDPSQ